MRSNVSVGPPLDLMIYRRDSLKPGFTIRLEDDDPYLQAIRDGWGGAIYKAFHDISHDPGWKILRAKAAAARAALTSIQHACARKSSVPGRRRCAAS
jgi:predicted proteasome-type protease